MERTPVCSMSRRSCQSLSQLTPSPISQRPPVTTPTPATKCPNCTKPVDEVGVQCDLCDSWYHHKCLNPKLLDKFIPLLANNFVLLQCRPCLNKMQLHNIKAVYDSGSVNPPLAECGVQTVSPDLVSTSTSPITPAMLPLNASARPFVTRKKFPVITLDDSPSPIIVHGFTDPLSNMYPFRFRFYHPVPFKTLEHCYQYVRAINQDSYDLAEKIRSAANGAEAKKLSRQLFASASSCRDDDVQLMEELLQAKAEQCFSFRKALRDSKSAPLVHSTYPSDKFWASGLHFRDNASRYPGKNIFGSLLEKLRSSIRPETGYSPPTLECRHWKMPGYSSRKSEDVVVILKDGESLYPPGGDVRPQLPTHTKSYASVVASGLRKEPDRDSVARIHRCFHCWVPGHTQAACRHRTKIVKCYGCNTVGHKRKFCSLYWHQKSQPPLPQPPTNHFYPFSPSSQFSPQPLVNQPTNTPFYSYSQVPQPLNSIRFRPQTSAQTMSVRRPPLLGPPINSYAANF